MLLVKWTFRSSSKNQKLAKLKKVSILKNLKPGKYPGTGWVHAEKNQKRNQFSSALSLQVYPLILNYHARTVTRPLQV